MKITLKMLRRFTPIKFHNAWIMNYSTNLFLFYCSFLYCDFFTYYQRHIVFGLFDFFNGAILQILNDIHRCLKPIIFNDIH